MGVGECLGEGGYLGKIQVVTVNLPKTCIFSLYKIIILYINFINNNHKYITILILVTVIT